MSSPINYCQLRAIIVSVLIIPTVNNVDDVEMTRRHDDGIHLQLENHFNSNELRVGTKNTQNWHLYQTGNLTVTVWEISEKADYIARRHRRLQDQWHTYCNSLIQGITLLKVCLHHAISCAPNKGLCSVLFKHFYIYVTPADGFSNHTIEYYVEAEDDKDKQQVAQAQLSIGGMIDDKVNIRDHEQVLEYCLEKIAGIYDSLYTAIENNAPVNLSQLVEGQGSTA